MPHHEVTKGKQGYTKWQIVFDASSLEKGTLSLNHTLEICANFFQRYLNVATLPAQPGGYCRRQSPGFPTVTAGREGQDFRKVF